MIRARFSNPQQHHTNRGDGEKIQPYRQISNDMELCDAMISKNRKKKIMSNKILNHPALICAQEISAICAPLQKLNISYFSHVHIDKKKSFSALGNNPHFAEHYLNNKYYTVDIHMVDESKFGDFFVWDGIAFSGESGKMCQEAGSFGIHNPFTIIDRNKNGIDYYHFANDSINKQINQTYLANLDLLQHFISHFKENINQSKPLMKAYDLTFDLNLHQTTHFEDHPISYDRSEFLRSIDTKKSQQLIIENVRLSKRQSDVLRLVVYGKTVKEIAQLMGLSERTVGHYVEAVRIKLNVSSRSELISKTINSKAIKIFANK